MKFCLTLYYVTVLKLINNLKVVMMAKNPPKDGSRKGAVKDRSQLQNPKTGLWTKRDSETGRFLDVKISNPEPFKGVKKEK